MPRSENRRHSSCIKWPSRVAWLLVGLLGFRVGEASHPGPFSALDDPEAECSEAGSWFDDDDTQWADVEWPKFGPVSPSPSACS